MEKEAFQPVSVSAGSCPGRQAQIVPHSSIVRMLAASINTCRKKFAFIEFVSFVLFISSADGTRSP